MILSLLGLWLVGDGSLGNRLSMFAAGWLFRADEGVFSRVRVAKRRRVRYG